MKCSRSNICQQRVSVEQGIRLDKFCLHNLANVLVSSDLASVCSKLVGLHAERNSLCLQKRIFVRSIST